MELFNKIIEFFDNNKKKREFKIYDYIPHIILIILLIIGIFLGIYYIDDIMSLIGLNNDSNDPNNVNEYGESTGYSDNH